MEWGSQLLQNQNKEQIISLLIKKKQSVGILENSRSLSSECQSKTNNGFEIRYGKQADMIKVEMWLLSFMTWFEKIVNFFFNAATTKLYGSLCLPQVCVAPGALLRCLCLSWLQIPVNGQSIIIPKTYRSSNVVDMKWEDLNMTWEVCAEGRRQTRDTGGNCFNFKKYLVLEMSYLYNTPENLSQRAGRTMRLGKLLKEKKIK